MPEPVPVFRLDLGPMDLLLAAADFQAVAARAECTLSGGMGASPTLETKGRVHTCRYLEPFLARLFPVTLPARGETFAAFLARGADGSPLAFVVARPFDMAAFPLSDFSLFPGGLRARLGALGMAALRFEGDRRLQVLLAPLGLDGDAFAGGGQ